MDFVRHEAAAALERDIAVIPVLVQGAEMPRVNQLPTELEALSWRNAFELRHNCWNVDVTELLKAVKKFLPTDAIRATPPWRLFLQKHSIALMAAIVVLGMAIFTTVFFSAIWPIITNNNGPAEALKQMLFPQPWAKALDANESRADEALLGCDRRARGHACP